MKTSKKNLQPIFFIKTLKQTNLSMTFEGFLLLGLPMINISYFPINRINFWRQKMYVQLPPHQKKNPLKCDKFIGLAKWSHKKNRKKWDFVP